MDRAHRLRKGAEFDNVYKFGAVSGGRLLVVRALPNDLGHPRWGFAVGKRLSKRATMRNRLKRRLKALADGAVLILSIDIVVTARAGALDAGTAELAAALARGVERAGQACPPATTRAEEDASP